MSRLLRLGAPGRIAERLLVASGVEARLDRAALARVRTTPGGAGHVLVAPPAAGNIGDQALVEAYLRGTSGPVVLIVSTADAVHVPAWAAERTTVLPLRDLVYGTGRAHRRAVARLADLLRDTSRLAVVGADVMDGRYSLRASVRRSSIAAGAAAAGVDSRLLGFSWSGAARPTALRALATASHWGARLLARDPVSLERLRASGVEAIPAADMVFGVEALDPALVERLDLDGAPFAVVNASGLIGRGVDQTAEYARVVGALRDGGRRVVLLPHVARAHGDDLEACAAVLAATGPDSVTLVTELATPDEVRALAARADVVVTGRMHLAVMSLTVGTPVIALATQGKVEGLMALFGTPQRCVEPRNGFAAPVLAGLGEILAVEAGARAAIQERLPHVQRLAAANLQSQPRLGATR